MRARLIFGRGRRRLWSRWGGRNVSLGVGRLGVPSVLVLVAATLVSLSGGAVVAWGCAAGDYGQCSVPGGLSGVTAISASVYHSLALKSDGSVVAWGCGRDTDAGQCSVPGGLSGVTAIAAGQFHSLALED